MLVIHPLHLGAKVAKVAKRSNSGARSEANLPYTHMHAPTRTQTAKSNTEIPNLILQLGQHAIRWIELSTWRSMETRVYDMHICYAQYVSRHQRQLKEDWTHGPEFL